MRLIGSLTEENFRSALSASNAALRSGDNTLLMEALHSLSVDLTTAFILDWIPEQGEIIYTVLDGNRQVLTIELARGESTEPLDVKAIPFAEYCKLVSRRSQREQLQFAVALDLLREATGDSA